MKILCLNIRGFGSGKASKIGDFKKLLFREHPCIVALQETRLNIVNKEWVNLVWGSNDFEFIQKEKIGNSGGFLIIWDKIEFTVEQTLFSAHNAEWVLCGDLNEVRDQSERKNCDFVERRAKWFNDFIEKNQLIDVPLGGKKFTRICDNGVKFSKLDRFLISENFHNTWGNVSALALERKLSDHCPIDSKKVVEDAWNIKVDGKRLDCVFRNKLKNVKQALKDWSKPTFGNLDNEIEELKRKVSDWEKIAESRVLSDEDRKSWMEARKKLLEKDKVKVSMARQKSRVKWVQDGDENTKYFHSLFKRRHSKRNIRGLNINGNWCEDPSEIKQAVHDHFKAQFGKKNLNKMRFADNSVVDGSHFQQVTSDTPRSGQNVAVPNFSDAVAAPAAFAASAGQNSADFGPTVGSAAHFSLGNPLLSYLAPSRK
ncbi:uncharacterized protein [Rutidosis leptorrhynchoides]|uniref:uncharacterized protein n=1 Tax=Rutidosis leptorrhynchoides TaxID=125765 RepID=UPI003A99A10F